VSVFDRIIERQLEEITSIANGADDPVDALTQMVLHHLGFALEDREHLTSWRQEFRTLRPDLSAAEARAAVHATLALLHSPTEYKSGLPSEALTPLLTNMALGALQ